MLSRSATQLVDPAPAMIASSKGALVDDVCAGPRVDLLDLDIDFEFMSAERRQQLMAPLPTPHESLLCQFPVLEDGSMQIVEDGVVQVRQEANYDEQARNGRDFQSFDVAPAPRPIKAHRRRISRHRVYTSPYQNPDLYTPAHAKNFDRDAHCSRRDHYSPSRRRDASLGTLKHRSEATFVAAMADLDVKEERDYDRRGTDSYRGGGNKRRRDGRLSFTTRPVLQ